jgi:serine/threonine-protein kinase
VASAARPAGAAARLDIHVRPYAQRALLDGTEIARNEQVVHILVPPGAHEVRIEHPCCATFVRRIDADEAAAVRELRVPLEPRPARLRVDGDPQTRVLVDGQDAGTAGDSQRTPFAVPIPAGGASPYEGTARIRLEPAGAPPSEVQVRIRAGESFIVAAPQIEALPVEVSPPAEASPAEPSSQADAPAQDDPAPQPGAEATP